MKRKIVNVSRMAHQLTDPKPEFVSHVRHGANQTPFRAVKADMVIADFSEMDLPEEKMTKKAKTTKTAKTPVELPPQAEIQKAVFASAQFDSAELVTEFLEAKGYSEFEVTKTDTGFEVIAKDAAEFEGDLKDIDVSEGVTFVVGKLAAGNDVLETEDEVATKSVGKAEKVFKEAVKDDAAASEVVKKYYDCYGNYCSSYTPPAGKTVADVLTENFSNGSFPGYWELSSAFATALFNLIKDGDNTKIKTLTGEYGQMIVDVLKALKAAGVDTTATKFLDEPTEGEAMKPKEAVTKVAKADDAAATETTDTNADPKPKVEGETEDKPAPKTEPAEGETEVEGAAKAEAATDIASIIAKAMKDVVTPLTEEIKSLKDGMAELASGTKESLADLDSKVSKTVDKVEELETVRTSRKSADSEGVVTGTQKADEVSEEEKANKAHSERLRKSAMGFMST